MTTIDIKKAITDAMKYANKVWQFINMHMSMAAHCFINHYADVLRPMHDGFKEFDEQFHTGLNYSQDIWCDPLDPTGRSDIALPSWYVSHDISDSKSKVISLMITHSDSFNPYERCYVPTIPVINIWNSGGEIGAPSTVYEDYDTDPVDKVVVRHHLSGYDFAKESFWTKNVEQWSERQPNGSLIRGGMTDTVSDTYLGASAEDKLRSKSISFSCAYRSIDNDNIYVESLYFD